MKFPIIAMVAAMAASVSASDQLFFASEKAETQLGGKFVMKDYSLNDFQKKDMEDWKSKMPVIFENKDYRMTWAEFWKAEEAQ